MNFKEALIAHEYAQVLRWIADGETVQFNPSQGGWEDQPWQMTLEEVVSGEYSPKRYRVKPRTIFVNGVEVPAPESVAPSHLAEYFTASPTNEHLTSGSSWYGTQLEFKWLERGLVYLNKEDAIARSKAMLITQEAV